MADAGPGLAARAGPLRFGLGWGDEDIVAVRARRCWIGCIALPPARAGPRRGGRREGFAQRRGTVGVDLRTSGRRGRRAHLHVVLLSNEIRRAWAKSRRQRTVPLDFITVQGSMYVFERMRAAGRGRGLLVGHLFWP